MNFKKAILSTTCLVLLSAPVHAGWDQNNQQKQLSARANIQTQLERLERENEQLRNAISQMRRSANAVNPPKTKTPPNDVRIQALIEENKRLMRQLDAARDQNIDNISVSKIYSLNQDNDRLQVQIKALRETNGLLMQDKKRLQKKIDANVSGRQEGVDTSKFKAQIQELNQKNKVLNDEIKLLRTSKDNSKGLKKQITEKSKEIAILESQVLSLQKDKTNLSGQLSTAQTKNNKEVNAQIAEISNKLATAQSENNALRQTKERLSQEKNLIQKELNTQISTKKIDTTAFETRIADLERQNNTLKVEQDKKQEIVKSSNDALEAKLDEKNILMSKLEAQVATLIKEKLEISSKLSKEKNKVESISNNKEENEKISALESQNKSLRETIKAQTSTLTQHDNAVKRAEALTSENIILKQQLEFANTAKSSNDDTAQNLIKKNKELIGQINNYKQQVNNVEGLKETIRALRDENQRYVSFQKKAKDASTQIVALEQQNKGLEEQLKKERASASDYRAELGKYQKQVKSLQKNEEPKEPNHSKEEAIMALRLENQELKARIDLLSSKASKTSVVFKKEEPEAANTKSSSETLLQAEKSHKNSDVQYIKGKTEILSKDIKVVETSYPKVDKVKPLLDDKGQHIYKSVKPEPVEVEDIQNIKSSGLNAEDLLSQELKPLSNQ